LPPVSIVSELVALDPVFVEMQKELAEGKTVEETSAGAELHKELRELKRQQKKDVIDLNKKIAEMRAQNTGDRLAREALEDESKTLKGQINELHLAMRSSRSEWATALAQLKEEKETSVKQRDLELENSRQAELRSEMELLKTLHAKEILECQFQIRSLLDGNSIDAFRKTQLEKTCEDLKATVSDLSLSLTRLRDTNEREAVERIGVMRQCNQLRANAATHEKTLDDLAEARSNIAQLKSQLQVSQVAQERAVSELDKVKSTLSSRDDIDWSTTSPTDGDIEDGDGWGSEYLSGTPSKGDAVQQGVHSDEKVGESVPKMLSELADMVQKERDASSASIVFQQWRWF